MRPQLDWRNSESKITCRSTFLNYYMNSSTEVRHAPMAITPGAEKSSELDFVLKNHHGEIHIYENNREACEKLQERFDKPNCTIGHCPQTYCACGDCPSCDGKTNGLNGAGRRNVYLHYADMLQLVSFSAKDTWGAVWADTCGFLTPIRAQFINRIIKNVMPGGVFAITMTRDGYRGWHNYPFNKTSFQPDSKVEIRYGWDSPMTFFCARKRA